MFFDAVIEASASTIGFQKNEDSERADRYLHRTLKQERFRASIVIFGLGRLYSRQNVIKKLIDKKIEMLVTRAPIRLLHDVRNSKMIPNFAAKGKN